MKTETTIRLTLCLQFFLCLILLSPTVYAQDTQSEGVTGRILSFLTPETYRVSLGGSSITLRNPVGFDVSSSTHQNGRPQSNVFSPGGKFSWTVAGETRINQAGRQKWLWSVHYDSEDFVGLELQNLMLGAGWSIDPVKAYAFGGRFAAGLGTGITRSSTFFDSAGHLSFEAWVSAGIQLGPPDAGCNLSRTKIPQFYTGRTQRITHHANPGLRSWLGFLKT